MAEERLQKLIAAAGVASRRKAEELIAAGEVTVNGRLVTELGAKADPERDHVKVRGRLLKHQEKIYILLNKPLGVLTSRSDPKNRPLVIDLLGPYRDKVHPVGRLDFNTEGLLLLTNDGDFTNLITGSKLAAKVYEVKVKGKPSRHQISMLERGVTVDGKRTATAVISLMEESATNAWYKVTLYEGRNQQIRKMFDHIGHSVIKLRRMEIGFLKNEKLKPGQFRMLSEAEVKRFFKLGKKLSPIPSKR
jgi:23S rRNA pseudouridine2605 synthase